MIAFIEMVFLYASIIAGVVTVWVSVYKGYPLASCLTRGLLVGAIFFALAVIARFVLYLSVYYGKGSPKAGAEPKDANEES